MELSSREVATLLGCSPRTVRARMARGDLPAVKRGGRWWVDRRRLPLDEPQRRRLAGKADALRQAVEAALPSRLARTTGQHGRSVADLEAFRRGAQLLAEVRAGGQDALPQGAVSRLTGLLEESLAALAEAVHHFDRERKLEALHRARTGLARAVAVCLIETGIPPPEPILSWVSTLELEVIPALAGFARWAEGLGGRRR